MARTLPKSGKDFFPVILFCGAFTFLAMSLMGLWQVTYIGFQDYPSHLFRSYVLRYYHEPQYNFGRFFSLNWGLIPNQAADFMIFLFSFLFSVEIATKLLFSLYMVLLPLSLFYFLKKTNPDNAPYAFLALPLTFNLFTAFANENYIISIPVFFFSLGYGRGHRKSFCLKTWLIQAGLLVVLYYCHMLTFAAAVIITGIFYWIEKWPRKEAAMMVATFIPGIFLFILWVGKMLITHTVSDSQLLMVHPLSSSGTTFKEVMMGISPAFLPETSLFSYRFIFVLTWVLMAAGGMWAAAKDKEKKKWVYIIGFLAILSLVLPPWVIIYAPGPRLALLVILLSTAIFPRISVVKYGFLISLIVFTFFVKQREMIYLDTQNRIISKIVQFFEKVPASVKERGEKVLPLVLPPYTYYRSFHRVFEYYNLINGGANPYHLFSQNFTVFYKIPWPAPPQYEPFPENLTQEILDFYPLILIIGKDGMRGEELMKYLAEKGFKEVSSDGFSSVWVRG